MAESIIVGEVAIALVPEAKGFPERMRASLVPSAKVIGDEWGVSFRDAVAASIGDLMTKWSESSATETKGTGAEAGASYGQSFKDAAEERLGTGVKTEVTAVTTEASASIDKMKAEAEAKPIVVKVVTEGGGASSVAEKAGASSASSDATALLGGASAVRGAEMEGENVAEGFGSRFSSRLKSVFSAGQGVLGGAISSGAGKVEKLGAEQANKFGGAFKNTTTTLFGPVGVGVAAVTATIVTGVKQFGNYQEGLTRLVTGAGESIKNLGLVSAGIKSIAVDTGTTLSQLTSGAFMIESAGFHGAAALDVLRAAAEGAKSQGADLGVVANATTTVMNDFGIKASDSAKAVDFLGTVVSHGKTTLQDLASSASRVLPTAAALHLSLGDVGGALATMTGEGVSAKLSAMGLNTAILALAAPNAVAAKTMNTLGMSTATAAKYQELLASGNKKAAAALLTTQDAAKSVADTLTHQGLIAAMERVQQLATQAGPVGSADYVAALKAMTGGNRGLQVALALTGQHLQTTKDNVAAVTSAVGGAGKNIHNWSVVQDDFNQKLSVLKERLQVGLVDIGEKAVPVIKEIVSDFSRWLPMIIEVGKGIGKLVVPVVLVFLTGLKTIFQFLTSPVVRLLVVGLGSVALAFWGLNAALAAFDALSPVGWITLTVVAITLVIGAVVKFHKEIVRAFSSLLHYLEWPFLQAWKFIKMGWDDVTAFVKKWWIIFVAVFTGPIGIIVAMIIKFHSDIVKFFQALATDVVNIWNTFWNTIKNAATAAIRWLVTGYTNFWLGLRRDWNMAIGFVSKIWNDFWTAIKNAATAAFRWLVNGYVNFWDGLKHDWDVAISWVKGIWSSFWSKIKDDASAAWKWISNGFSLFWSGIKKGWQTAVSDAKSIWHGIQAAVDAPVKFVVDVVYNNGIVKVVDAISGIIGKKALSPITLPKGFASGTSNAPPGWAWVGEKGPELINMRGGETVIPSHISMALATPPIPGYAEGTSDVAGLLAPPTTPQWNPFSGAIGLIKSAVHGVEHLGESAFHALRSLAGDALAEGMNLILNPLLNLIPGTGTPIGSWIKQDIVSLEQQLVNWVKGVTDPTSSNSIGGGSGAQVAAYANTFGTGHGHPYVLGGASPSGWDCSGFSAFVYDHFGYFPGQQGQRFGTSETQWTDSHLQPSGNTPGALVFFDDHIFAPPGHVGVVLNNNSYVSAYDTAEGTVVKPIVGPMGYRIPKGGFHTQSNAGAGSYTPGSGVIGQEQRFAFSRFGQYGWGSNQQQPLVLLWNQESGWNADAVNPSSGAYGIPQSLGHGHPYNLGDWAAQIIWGEDYIQRAYGNPSAAWAHEKAFNWYAGGTAGAAPGWAWVGENGMELVNFHGGETVLSHENSLAMANSMHSSGSWNGVAASTGMDQHVHAESLKSAVKGLEQRLELLIKATKSVGGDVGHAIDSTGRVARNQGAFRR